MPPRIHPPSKAIAAILRCKPLHHNHSYATAAVFAHPIPSNRPKDPSTQPPSYKPADLRKTQLLRQYASLLRSTPLMLLFQHNNLKSSEWISVRRELVSALRKVDALLAETNPFSSLPSLADGIKLQIVQVGIFAAALRVVEYYTPGEAGEELTHVLGEAAHEAAVKRMRTHALSPLLSGPLAVLTFPEVSPAHLKAALCILSPSQPGFPAPTRRANPGWHEPQVQGGVQKLLMIAARVEGRVMDVEGAKWVGGIEGGLGGLQAQLVHLLQSFGAGVTNTLEGMGKSLYLTVEGRRTMLEDEAKGPAVEEVKEV